ITFYKLLHFRIQSRFGLPFSLWIALMAATIAISILRQKPWAQNPGPARLIRYRGTRICLPVPSRAWSRIGLLYGLQLIAIGSLFALGQMFCFGYTDYRRPAAVALTFGARVYENGRMSAALYDRTHTAVSLYKTGLVQHLLFSGGPVGNGMHEVEVMRDYAVRQGVPPARIFLDYNGLNTRSSVEYTCDLLVKRNWSSVLAVSTFYHLPRIKLSFQRAGCTAYTVPAVESRILLKLPLYLLREIPAFWSYYALAVESEKLPVAAPRSQ
ncbi:MAG: YdcF family protein, partial [Leptospiraceae bacterium]|nr:YdcF family protein [Leptospiraceae bacterium]